MASYMAWNKSEPAAIILQNLTRVQKQILYDKTMPILSPLPYSDLATLTNLAMDDTIVNQKVIKTVVDHVSNELNMDISFVSSVGSISGKKP